MREWIERLRRENELITVETEVDWKYELGCLIRRVFDIGSPRRGPALLFTNIKDYKKTHGRQILTASLSTYGRVALALGLAKETDYAEIVKAFKEKSKRRIKPKLVDHGPCKEVIEQGNDINVLEFPVPYLNPMDAGRYVGTFCAVITKDPETGWRNVGMYRLMVHDRNHLGAAMLPSQHWGLHFQKYSKMNRPMPVAVAIGQDQVNCMVASTPFPAGVDEFEVAGALRDGPVELVKCESVDLEVPASAEIVLEGEIMPGVHMEEGPFGEYTGYMGGEKAPRPVIEIKCVTHRQDPILQITLEGRPVPGCNEDHTIESIQYAAGIWQLLSDCGIEVVGVGTPTSSSSTTHCIVSIRQRYAGEARRIASILWGSGFSLFGCKHIVVVDEDIDPNSLEMVNWAVAYRVKADEDIWIASDLHGLPLDPRIPPEEKGMCTRMLIDATRPFEWGERMEWKGKRFPPLQAWPEETEDRVELRWKDYGLETYALPKRFHPTY